MTEPTSVPQPRSADEFRLDVEGARAAVTALEGVREKLITLRFEAAEFARSTIRDQSAHDLISSEAFLLLAQKADGAPGSFAAALEGAIEHVQQLMDEMKRDIAEHDELDDVGAAAFRAR